MYGELPQFRRVKRAYAASIAHSVLSGPRGSALLKLTEYDDGHFRAMFAASYFQLAEGRDGPSKSQWNTLKKKLKRRNRSIFVFRDHGETECAEAETGRVSATCLFLEFGFMAN